MALGACYVGPSVEAYPPAGTPFGTVGEFEVGRAKFKAELLAVRDSGLLVLRDRHVTVIPYPTLQLATFSQLSFAVSREHPPTPKQASELRLLSRFPQGLSAEFEHKLLAAYGQAAPLTIGSCESTADS